MIFVISAPSGAGKTTLINKLLKSDNDLEFSISTTTRDIRKGEIDGVNYHFISKSEFCKMIENGEFLEWAEVHGNYYGTTKKEVDRLKKSGKIPLFDVDIQGGRNLKEKMTEGVFIFIIPPSLNILRQRLILRDTETEDQITLRLKNAYNEIAEYVNFDYLIVNSDLDSSFQKLSSIIIAEKCKVKNIRKEIRNILEAFNDYTA